MTAYSRPTLADRYRVEREIGRGASATVYLARDLKLGRPVAIKVIRPELAAGLSAERFLQEVRVTAQLHHPHILQLHDSGETESGPYFVMPYVAGETLRERLRRDGRLPIADALLIAREVGDALHYAHERRLVHRDVKPENILLSGGHALVADFGIVRALDLAETGKHRFTDEGFSPGTPEYMSPEAVAGDEVDGRSDQYSLGCVLFEMLTGRKPFEGTSVRAIMMRRLVERPEPVRALRPDLPARIAAAVDRALSTAREDRYASTAELVVALGQTSGPSEPPRPRPRAVAARVAATAVAAVALVAAAWRYGPGPGPGTTPDVVLDTSRYAVVPFAHAPGAPAAAGERAAMHLDDALAEWDGVDLVRALLVNDAAVRAAERGGADGVAGDGPDDARRLARSLGAGRVVHGRVVPDGDSLRVDAALYDVASGDVLQSAVARVGPDLAGSADAFASLARRLLAAAPGVGAPPTTASGGTRSLPAWRAYERGQLALRGWDVDAAAAAFGEAALADPEFARAHLWRAQTLAWSRGGTDARGATEEREAASRAASLAPRLPPRDRALAAALLALTERRFAQSCAGFASLVARDSLDFGAWYGLGLCQWRDDVVLPDARSPSGWRFRASHHAASVALLRAMRIAPSFQRAFAGTAAARLAAVLRTDVGMVRGGFADGAPDEGFYALPSLAADTIAYVPWPARDFVAGRRETLPASYGPALERNRRVVRDLLSDWARAFPRSAEAMEALAVALEASGELRAGRPGDPSAFEAFDSARALTRDTAQKVRVVASMARVHLELGQLARARALADSLLRAWPDDALRPREDRTTIADRLAGLAALTGRAHRAAALLALASSSGAYLSMRGAPVRPPPELAAEGARLTAYASLGAAPDSVRTLVARIERQLVAAVEPTRRADVRWALLARSRSLAVSSLGTGIVAELDGSGDLLVGMQQALARGDRAGLARQVGLVDRAREGLPAGVVPPDAHYHEAWLLLAAGDTAAARTRLDAALGALSALGPWATVRVSEAGALVRAMALRAELAAALGDAPAARQWAAAVTTLWADADPELQPLVARMRAIAAR